MAPKKRPGRQEPPHPPQRPIRLVCAELLLHHYPKSSHELAESLRLLTLVSPSSVSDSELLPVFSVWMQATWNLLGRVEHDLGLAKFTPTVVALGATAATFLSRLLRAGCPSRSSPPS
jgi:hypothetical protein